MTDDLALQFERDDEVRRLGRALSLSETFRFFVVRLARSSETRALIRALEQQVELETKEQRPWLTLSPYSPLNAVDGVTQEDLLQSVLEPLYASIEPRAVFVIDAAPATRRDGDAWRWLFRRLNEQRDAIARIPMTGLVLVVPRALEEDLHAYGPDLWSIRSGEYRPVSLSAQRPRDPLELEEDHPEQRLDDLLEQLSAAAHKRQLDPSHENTLAWAAIVFRLADEHIRWGSAAAALPAVLQAIEALRRINAESPGSADHELLALGLDRAAALHEELGDDDAALRVRVEQIAAATALEALVPAGARPKVIDFVNHARGRFAMTLSALGRTTDALSAITTAIDQQRSIVDAFAPNEYRWHAWGLRQMRASILSDSGRIDEALAECEALIDEVRSRGVTIESRQRLRDFSIMLVLLADLLTVAGRLDAAEAPLVEALTIRERLMQQDPSKLDARREVGVVLQRLARVHWQRGTLGAAQSLLERHLDEAIATASMAPDRPQLSLDVALAHADLAALAEHRSETHKAHEHWTLALNALGRGIPTATRQSVDGERVTALSARAHRWADEVHRVMEGLARTGGCVLPITPVTHDVEHRGIDSFVSRTPRVRESRR